MPLRKKSHGNKLVIETKLIKSSNFFNSQTNYNSKKHNFKVFLNGTVFFQFTNMYFSMNHSTIKLPMLFIGINQNFLTLWSVGTELQSH